MSLIQRAVLNLILVSGLWFTPVLQGQQPFYRYYTLNEGFPQAQVWKIMQSRNGLMWFATGNGLVIYNGTDYQLFSKEYGVVGNARNIFEDDQNQIWIPSDDGLAVFDGHHFRDLKLPEISLRHTIWDILKDRHGRYWVPSRFNGLYRMEDNRFIRIADSLTRHQYEFFSCFSDKDGELWFGSKNEILWLRFDGKKYASEFIFLSDLAKGFNSQVNDIQESPFGEILFCTSDGLILFNKNLYQQDKPARDYLRILTPKEGLIHRVVTGVTVTRDSAYWIVTDYGISVYHHGRFRNYTIDEHFSVNSLLCIIQDHEGVLWIGTNGGGCIKIPYQDVLNFSTKDGLPSNVINALAFDTSGNLYIASDNGVDVWNGKRLFPLQPGWHQPGDAVWVVKYHPNGSLWIGTEDHIYEYKNKRFIEHRELYISSGASLLDIEIDRNGHLWFGSHDGLVFYNGKGYQKFTLNEGLPGLQIWCVYEDRQGNIWLGSNNGLIRVHRDSRTMKTTFTNWTTQQGLPHNTVNVIRQDPDGLYWIGTDDGLARFDGQRFIQYKPKQLGLYDNVVPVIEYDSLRRSLWIGSTAFGRFEIQDTLLVLKELWNKNRGLRANEATTNNSLIFDADGNLWIGTFGGLTYYLRSSQLTAQGKPKAMIQKMITPEMIWICPPAGPVQWPSQKIRGGMISFEFAGLSFIHEPDNQFQYFLDGFDDDWSEFTPRREIRYTNLWPGEYTLRLRVKNAAGMISSAEDTFTFTVKTPLWLNPFILLSVIVLGFIGIYKAHKYRVHKKVEKIHRLNLELEQKIAERTAEITKQKEELEALFTQLKQTHTQLLQSEKMASLGQLVAGVAHEINNPTSILAGNVNYIEDYMNTIRGLLKLYESFPWTEEFQQKVQIYKNNTDYEFIISDLDVLIASVKNAAERIRHIVLDLRNFSRLDEAELTEILIDDCIDTTVKLFMNQFKQILVIRKDFRTTKKIFCYVNQINQVLLNILINAAHAIEDKINRIKPQQKPYGEINIYTSDSPDGIIIKIRDNGCGIKEEHLPKIFDPFFTTKPVGQGTGLGLSITYGIIEKHTGRIQCQSQYGEWTEFTIELPVRPRETS